MDDERDLRPVPVRGVDLGGEVVEVEHLRAIGARRAQRDRPGVRQMRRERGRDRRQHGIGDAGPVLVRGVHRHGRRGRVAARPKVRAASV